MACIVRVVYVLCVDTHGMYVCMCVPLVFRRQRIYQLSVISP